MRLKRGLRQVFQFALSLVLVYNLTGCMKSTNDLLTKEEINQKVTDIEMKNMPQLLGSTVFPPSNTTSQEYSSWKRTFDQLKQQTTVASTREQQEELLKKIEEHTHSNPAWKSQMKNMAQKFEFIAADRKKLCEQEIQSAQSRILAGEDKNKVLQETFQKIDELDRGPKGMSLGIGGECRKKLRKL
ncbi:MAG: hypothetical protein HYS98_02645 [Deltaproteobacteria bacterium]|nr:hypothetical protein [Deltaproteobacteria bacterium]